MQLTPNQTLVISLSGGKDSTATALHLLETGVIDRHVQAGGEVRRVFLDSGWELDETYRYLDEVLTPRLGQIDRAALWVPGPGEAPPEGYDHLEPLWATPGKTMAADRWALARVLLELPKWADLGSPTWFQDPTGDSGSCIPIDGMMAWALAEPRKGGQIAMFPHHEPPGCSIWGLCEVPRGE